MDSLPIKLSSNELGDENISNVARQWAKLLASGQFKLAKSWLSFHNTEIDEPNADLCIARYMNEHKAWACTPESKQVNFD